MAPSLRVLTYNMHLFGSTLMGALYARDGLRAGLLVEALLALEPDLVALTEIWDIAYARRLVRRLSGLYPYYAHGPFRGGVPGRLGRLASYGLLTGALAGGVRATLPLGAAMLGYALAFGDRRVIGSGLLLLSRWPIAEAATFRPFATEEPLGASDRFAQKGVLSAEVLLEGDRRLDVLVTHMQAGSTAQARATRAGQISEVARLSRGLRVIHPERPQLIMGDCNVIGEEPGGPSEEYQAMVEAWSGLVDTFRHAEPRASGLTFDADRNALAARFASASRRGRLDYIFASAPLVVEQARVRDDVDPRGEISDHYPLEATLRW